MPKSRKRKLNRDSAAALAATTSERVSGRAAIRPGTFNLDGDFFTPEGGLIRRARAKVTPGEATTLVRLGARVAFEGCGCGGGGGCTPSWPDPEDIAKTVAAGAPRFTNKYGSPTWIDVWTGEGESVVFLHGDVQWGNLAE